MPRNEPLRRWRKTASDLGIHQHALPVWGAKHRQDMKNNQNNRHERAELANAADEDTTISPNVALMERLLTMDDLAARTQTSKSTLYSLRSQGRGPRGFRIGRGLRFHPSDVDRWLAALADEAEAA